MLRALYTGEEGQVVACGVRTERALVARGLIHPVESTLTEKGSALLAKVRGQGTAMGSITPRTAADLPKGTRVMCAEGRMGTVNGGDIGRVTNTDHPNHGREYVGVWWDAVEGDMGCNRRSRPFVDELTVVGGCGVTGTVRCPAAHPDDPTPCDGPAVVTVLDAYNDGADGCEHHGARLLASLERGSVYALPDAPAGAAIRVFIAADDIPPFVWYEGAPRTQPSQRSRAENGRKGGTA
ncbi:hypothetical protein LRS74_22675 [Streptomyces sp. LX-29]|uniref:hypothetical protein n=1 Tax=Streptomyces sp. LX-29 TaxID=2900152 RepID=UPI00240E578C|nr:hypothetical protein [Streptomyces sp. LX-29]WFB09539.1 hypothetical protein LRS74_22675 [Streptomyces sp. LX-29]